MTSKPLYRRILLKASGEALMGDQKFGIDVSVVDRIAADIADLAGKAQVRKLRPDEMGGASMSISNLGGIGGTAFTPIVNPPQSGVLGMHAIQDRPVARDGQVVIRPMMYLALTYDHRLVDGREAVTFLRRVKDLVENPARMLLEV